MAAYNGIQSGDSVIAIVQGAGVPVERSVEKVVIARQGALALLGPRPKTFRIDPEAHTNWFSTNFVFKSVDSISDINVGDMVVAIVEGRDKPLERQVRKIATSSGKTLLLLTSHPDDPWASTPPREDAPWFASEFVHKKVQEFEGISVGDTITSVFGREKKAQRVLAITDAGQFYLEDGIWWPRSRLHREIK